VPLGRHVADARLIKFDRGSYNRGWNDLTVAKETRYYKGPVYLTFHFPLAPSLEQPASLDMIPRVQSAIDVKTAIEKAWKKLTKIGFDASVLIDAYAEQSHSPDPDEDTPVLDKKQMVRHFELSSSECLTLFPGAHKQVQISQYQPSRLAFGLPMGGWLFTKGHLLRM
jgi:hypothetical protein